MKVKFFSPGLGYSKIKNEIDSEIQRVLLAGDLILRNDVEKFERNLANYVGKKYAVGLNSGTDALYLSLWALGIGEGDGVIVPSHTFVATVQVVKQLGATPILADLDGLVEKNIYIYPPKAAIYVHISGEVNSIPDDPDWVVIEDACQALGNKKVGKGLIQCWSFYPAKILGSYGDAGAITTNDENIYNEIKELRNHYKKDYSKWGINSRMDNLQAAILNVKFKYLQDYLDRRLEIALLYEDNFSDLPLILPKYNPNRVYQDFIIQTEKRDELYEFLKENEIETMKNEYPMPIPKLPKAKQYEAETLRIPCNPDLTNQEVEFVIDKIREFFNK